MDALVSGAAGIAVLLDGGKITSIDVNDVDTVRVHSQSEAQLLMRGVRFDEVLENVGPAKVKYHLKVARDKEDSLHLFLGVLDKELSEEIRADSAKEVEDMLTDKEIASHLRNILYAHELPKCADVEGGLKCCEAREAKKAGDFIRRLLEMQQYIYEVRIQWEAVPQELFDSREAQQDYSTLFVREGLFSKFVENRASGKTADIFRFDCMANPVVSRTKNHREIISQWVRTFQVEPQGEKVAAPEAKAAKERRKEDKKRRGRPIQHKAKDVKPNVDRQKKAIVKAMQDRKTDLVQRYLDELIEYHLGHAKENKGPGFACMSLCDLAMEAKRLGMYSLQLEMTKQAVELGPSDGWAWAQYGDALLHAGLFEKALAAYDTAIAYKESVEAKCGRAEVLKSMGRFEEALSVYEQINEQHPEDVVAKNGRAEVLKSMGRFEEALSVYEQANEQHPESVVAKTGRAEVLKSMGRFEEALSAYEQVNKQHPEDVVTKNGRAEVLKSMGRFEEALSVYEQVNEQHPEDVVAKTGRAEVLKSMGRLEEALSVYEQVNEQHPENVVAKSGRAEVLKSMGRFEEALSVYEQVNEQHPEDVFVRNGIAGVLIALGETGRARDYICSNNPKTKGEWIGNHIYGMLLLQEDKVDEAIKVFENGVENNPWPSSRDYYRSALGLARIRRREFERATAVLEEVETPIFKVAAEVFRVHAYGRLGECEKAAVLYEGLPEKSGPTLKGVKEELRLRYVAFGEPEHDEEWLFAQEERYLLELGAAA